jgi:hypothetical protein
MSIFTVRLDIEVETTAPESIIAELANTLLARVAEGFDGLPGSTVTDTSYQVNEPKMEIHS